MDCADEVEAIQRVLKPLAGVREVRVNLLGGKVKIFHDQRVTSPLLIKTIGAAGLKASAKNEAVSIEGARKFRKLCVAASGLFTGLGLLLQWLKIGPASVPDALFAVAIIAGGILIFPKAFAALRHFALDMNVLMTVAVTGRDGKSGLLPVE